MLVVVVVVASSSAVVVRGISTCMPSVIGLVGWTTAPSTTEVVVVAAAGGAAVSTGATSVVDDNRVVKAGRAAGVKAVTVLVVRLRTRAVENFMILAKKL